MSSLASASWFAAFALASCNFRRFSWMCFPSSIACCLCLAFVSFCSSLKYSGVKRSQAACAYFINVSQVPCCLTLIHNVESELHIAWHRNSWRVVASTPLLVDILQLPCLARKVGLLQEIFPQVMQGSMVPLGRIPLATKLDSLIYTKHTNTC